MPIDAKKDPLRYIEMFAVIGFVLLIAGIAAGGAGVFPLIQWWLK